MFDSIKYKNSEDVSTRQFLIETGVILVATIALGYALNTVTMKTEITNIAYVAFYVTLFTQLLRAA